jgi:hypothetical protein
MLKTCFITADQAAEMVEDNKTVCPVGMTLLALQNLS